MASTTACTEAVPLVYPQEVKNDSARKAYKLKLLKDRPETLFADLYKSGEVSNLIFLTDQPLAWHAAISAHYPSVKKEGICNGWKIKIKEVEDPDTVMTTVNMNGPNRRNLPPLTTTTPCQRQTPPPLQAAPADPEKKEPTGPEPDPQLDRAITDLKVKFIELERELVQLRELISQQPAQDTRVQQDSSAISTELTKLRQDRDSNRRELSTVRTEVRELQQDRESHMARLTALTEEVRELREERRSYRRELTALSEELQERERVKEQLDSHPDHNQNPVTPIESSQNPPTQQPPSTPSSISSPHANPTPRSPPITQMNTTPSPQTNTTPHPSRPAQQRGKPDIVILIDSNGKFIDENKLFPTHTVAKIWCPNTQHAMDLLSEQQLGSPSHIIIHTGSNDLRSQQERVSESLRGVIEKASTTFPNSRVVMSTLLPRKDLHPDTIHRINSNMSRDCILRPNVHLAHHPTLDINCLYDHVHLYKNTVPIFARTLKDVALNRDQSTPRRRSSPAQNPLRPERHPTGPPPRQHPWRQDHPHLLPHHAPLRSHQGSYDYPQARPEPLLSPGVPPQPQRRELHPDPLSYAQAVKRTAGPTLTTTTHVPEPTHTPPHDELRDIQQMLSLLCSHLIGQVPQ
ncbi:Platelet-activating factor acetylhydrolase IB subunit beta like [Dissostichus eleginoides]|uniref:Platelet-activating factor acetylhydrolase IB subunit beta like n=3 Tax=Dissostichus eleginoides TaxID=100907 RepID=A0AAD9B1Y4_DISEL|nr:Platelet-activating factor acetylhydrolase IB subunit beta like [Dissostichus eleginoides]